MTQNIDNLIADHHMLLANKRYNLIKEVRAKLRIALEDLSTIKELKEEDVLQICQHKGLIATAYPTKQLMCNRLQENLQSVLELLKDTCHKPQLHNQLHLHKLENKRVTRLVHATNLMIDWLILISENQKPEIQYFLKKPLIVLLQVQKLLHYKQIQLQRLQDKLERLLPTNPVVLLANNNTTSLGFFSLRHSKSSEPINNQDSNRSSNFKRCSN